MKVLIINGSPRVGGNTSIALDEMVKVFESEGVETEVVLLHTMSLISTSQSVECQLHPVSTGIVSMAEKRGRQRRISKVSRQCVLLQGT